MRIGSVAAETDDDFLFSCFVHHPAVSDSLDVASRGMVIAGSTGSGKTAILRYIERTCENVVTVNPMEMSLSYVSNSDILRFVQAIGGDLDLLFLALWKHVLCLEFIRLRYKVNDEAKSKGVFQRLRERFLNEPRKNKSLAYLREWEGKFWETMDENIRHITEKYERDLQAEFGADLGKWKQGGQYEKRMSTERKAELVARSKKIINADQLRELSGVIEMLAEENDDHMTKFYILVDRLDERWVDVSIKFKLIRSLIEAIKSFRKIKNLKILIAMCSDVLEKVVQESKDHGFQREKFEDYFLNLRWRKSQIKEILDKRVSLLFKRQYSPSANVTFSDLFSKSVGGIDAFTYIIDRTLMRPRDAIVFVNLCLDGSEGRDVVPSSVIREAEVQYSKSRRAALEDEWRIAFPSLSKLLDFIRSFRSPTVTFEQMCAVENLQEVCLGISSDGACNSDPLYELANCALSGKRIVEFVYSIISVLYRVGAIGIKKGPQERFHWSNVDSPMISAADLGEDTRIRVHLMLYGALGLIGLDEKKSRNA